MRWSGVLVLALALGCTVGEARPERPEAPAPAEPVPGDPPRERDGVPAGDTEYVAADLLTRAQLAYEALDLDQALELARRVVDGYPASSAVDQARWLAARAAFSLGYYADARSLAEAYRRTQPAGSNAAAEARSLADLAADALERPTAAAVVGVVLPRTGSRVLVQYGDWVLEGIELAVREVERRQNRTIELVVMDDEGGVRTGGAVRELERRGALAIIGPLLEQHVDAAADARGNRQLLLVSPTLPAAPARWSQVYTLSGTDTRGAQELARYAAEVGLEQAAILHARGAEHRNQAQAFAVEYEAMGGTVRATVPYDSGTTTFATHMQRVLRAVAPPEPTDPVALTDQPDHFPDPWPDAPAASPDTIMTPGEPDPWRGRVQQPFALFVAAPERDVPQIAPQISFYGLDSAGVQVVGGEAWASAWTRRMVSNRDLEGVVAASRFPPARADGLADPDFVALYESTYRRSLPNHLPALGYDATNLVLQALPNRLLTPGATARRFELLTGIPGATGLLSVRASRLVRTPYIVVIRNGRLQPAPSPWDYELPVPRPPTPIPADTTVPPDGR